MYLYLYLFGQHSVHLLPCEIKRAGIEMLHCEWVGWEAKYGPKVGSKYLGVTDLLKSLNFSALNSPLKWRSITVMMSACGHIVKNMTKCV